MFEKIYKFYQYILILITGIIMIIVNANVFFRYILNQSLGWVSELSRYLFIWLVFMGAVVAYDKNDHIGLEFVINSIPSEKIKTILKIVGNIGVLIVIYILIRTGYTVALNTTNKSPALEIVLGKVYSIIPITSCFMLILGRRELMMLWIFLGSLFFFVFLGIPVAFSLGLSNLILMWTMDFEFIVLTKKMISGIDNFPLLAIPFFMFVGKIMNKGGLARRLVRFAESLIGFITGGLGHVNILASMFFGGISGSAIADTAAIGGLLIPPMIEEKYPADYSGAITASSAVIGIIIPPSIPFILYGITTNTSIAQLFMGGIIPGIIVGLSLMVTTYFTTRRYGYGNVNVTKTKKFDIKEVYQSFKEAFLTLLLPLVIVGGILSGIFTATEAGAIEIYYYYW